MLNLCACYIACFLLFMQIIRCFDFPGKYVFQRTRIIGSLLYILVKKCCVMVCISFSSLRIGFSGGLLSAWWWTSCFHKRPGISSQPELLSVSQERLLYKISYRLKFDVCIGELEDLLLCNVISGTKIRPHSCLYLRVFHWGYYWLTEQY
jgi:hypothetical protein